MLRGFLRVGDCATFHLITRCGGSFPSRGSHGVQLCKSLPLEGKVAVRPDEVEGNIPRQQLVYAQQAEKRESLPCAKGGGSP